MYSFLRVPIIRIVTLSHLGGPRSAHGTQPYKVKNTQNYASIENLVETSTILNNFLS